MLELILVMGAFVLILTLAGISVGYLAIPDFNVLPLALRFGVGYFLGIACFLVSYRLLNFLMPNAANILLCITLAAAVALIALQRRIIMAFFGELRSISIATGFLIICGVFAFTLLTWLIPNVDPRAEQMYWHIGSGHPGRYANIALAIVQLNWIPVIPQHFGQSILLSALYMMGLKKVFVILHFFLSISITALIVTCYGLLQSFGLGRRHSTVGSIIVMCGNSALSILHVLDIDSGNPIIANGITDNIILLGTTVALFIWLRRLHEGDIKNITQCVATPATLFILWCFTAEQGLILLLPVVLWGLTGIFTKKVISLNRLASVVGLLFLAVGVGIAQGGALTPKELLTKDLTIQGMVSTHGKAIEFHPFLPHQFSAQYFKTTTWHSFEFDRDMLGPRLFNDKSMSQKIWIVESNLWSSLRIFFFPMLGLVSLAYMQRRIGDSRHRALLLIGGVVFGLGYFLTFFLSMGNMKWEMARFMLLGYFFGMLALVVVLEALDRGIRSSSLRILLWAGLALFVTVGPALNYSAALFNNVLENGAFKLYLQDR